MEFRRQWIITALLTAVPAQALLRRPRPTEGGSFCGFNFHSKLWFRKHHRHEKLEGSLLARTVDVQKAHSSVCIDDMCAQAQTLSPREAPVKKEVQVLRSRSVAQFLRTANSKLCEESVPSNERVLAVPIVPAYHASTALEQLLMSSAHLTTLCSAGTWQCESKWILKHFAEGGEYGSGKSWENYIQKRFPQSEFFKEKKTPIELQEPSLIGTRMKDFWTWLKRENSESPQRIESSRSNRVTVEEKSLGIFSEYWNLSRRVLLVKRPTNGTDLIPRFINPFENSGIPEAMKAAGIDTLKVIYLIMWRPICLSKLSSHAKDTEKYVNHELFLLEQSLQAYRYLKENGHRVMAINLGDLLWNRELVRERLYSAMPCLGQLQFDYKPEIGKDVSECNEFKANSSIEEFADKISSQDFSFNSASGTCDMGEQDSDLSRHLPPLQRERLQKTMLELAALSRL